MKALVSWGAGFIGCNVAKELLHSGCEVAFHLAVSVGDLNQEIARCAS